MAVATISDIELYLGRPLTDAQTQVADATISRSQLLVEAYLKRKLETASFTSTTTIRINQTFIDLPYTPVNSVTSVTVDGVAWAAGTWTMERSGIQLDDVSLNPNANNTSTVVVVYNAGLGSDAKEIGKMVVIAHASRLLNKLASDQLGMESLSEGGVSETYMSEWLTQEEMAVLTRWRRRVASNPPVTAPALWVVRNDV